MSDEDRRPVKERRHLTVMFVDLVGSTGLVDELDPEDAQNVFDAFSGKCAQLIKQFGGYIARIEGDGILAYFGFPSAREDASEQAVRAGLAVAEAVARIRTPMGTSLACRTGIASGSVLVGEAYTSSGSIFYEVIGRAPHVARRLQEQVEPGEVAISDAAYRKAGGFFVCAPNPPIRLKGFRNPEMFWRVRGHRELPLRFLARDALQRCAFVGRTEELTVLHRLWDGARLGQGAAVGVVGPAGIGKSRVIYEFVHSVAEDSPHLVLMQGNTHHRNSPWQPLRDELIRHLDTATPPGGSRLETLTRELASSASAQEFEDAQAILRILEDGQSGVAISRPGEERARVVAALVRRLEALAGRAPVIVVIEDVQWLDDSSAEWLEALCRVVERHPIQVVLTSRETLSARLKLDVTEIQLSGLTQEDARAMVDLLISEKPFAHLDAQAVLAKVGGIPLFIEEYVTHQLDRVAARKGNGDGREVDPDDAPTTLMDLLNERIDELGPGKAFIQTCAVCGDVFDLRLVARTVGVDVDHAIAVISDLESRGILTGSAAVGDEFRFRHALLRDAGYSSLLKADRAALHGRIAQAMETYAAEDGFAASPEVLAWHFSEADEVEKCLTYRLAAAEKFKGQYAATESIHQLELAAAEADAMEEGGRRREWLVRIYNLIGATRNIFYGWGDQVGQEMFEKALSLTVSSDDGRSTFDAVRGLWNANMIQGNYPLVEVLTRQLSAIAARSRDPMMRVDAANANGAYRLWSGGFKEANASFQEALRLYGSAGINRAIGAQGTDPGVVALCLSAWNFWFLGDREAAFETIKAAKQRSERMQHVFGLAYSHSICASMWQCERNPEQALAEANQSTLIASENKSGMRYWIDRGGFLSGWAISFSGDRQAGITRIRNSIDSYKSSGGGQLLPYARTLLAECLLASDLLAEAEAELTQAGADLPSEHPYYYDSERLRLHGEVLIRRGYETEGAEALASALSSAEAFDSPPLRKAVLETRARLQRR
ncbi:ATP-binding protein [Thalassobaculum litoreum]|nr:adenylate/guanylate cyclase domain-containing protein [Thalassobaculum litoreum]